MALTNEEAAELASLKAARRRLIRGEATAEVASHGRSKKFAQADMKKLEGEIEMLEASQTSGRPARKRGAITFRFR